MVESRRQPHPLRHTNPRQIDLGMLVDSATGDEIAPASPRQAADFLKAARRMGMADAVIFSPIWATNSALARVEPPRYIEPITVAEWRLIVSIALRGERAEDRETRQQPR